jgi:hypothetical protein
LFNFESRLSCWIFLGNISDSKLTLFSLVLSFINCFTLSDVTVEHLINRVHLIDTLICLDLYLRYRWIYSCQAVARTISIDLSWRDALLCWRLSTTFWDWSILLFFGLLLTITQNLFFGRLWFRYHSLEWFFSFFFRLCH